MGPAGSSGGQRHGGQRLHALAWPGQPTRGSCAPRSIIPPGGGAAGAGPAGTLPPALRHGGASPPRLSCWDVLGAPLCETCPATHLGAVPHTHAHPTGHLKPACGESRPLRGSPLLAPAPYNGSLIAARYSGTLQVCGWHQRLGSDWPARTASQAKQTPNTRGIVWASHSPEGHVEKSLT